MSAGIYVVCNVENHKVYVGQSQDLLVRKLSHFGALSRGKHRNPYLQRAYNLQGPAVFEFCILDDEVPAEQLDSRECMWIAYYNSRSPEFGYNLESGGSVNKRLSVATRLKMSLARVGRPKPPVSAETRVRMSSAARLRVRRPFSEETKRKISNALLGKRFSAERCRRMSLAMKGKSRGPLSPLTRARISEALTGLVRGPLSVERRRQLSLSSQGRPGRIPSAVTRERMRVSHLGKKLTVETRAKISAALKSSPRALAHRMRLRILPRDRGLIKPEAGHK